MQSELKSEITIEVSGPETNTTSNQPFVTYLISGVDKNGQFSVRRRYSDFYALRQALIERWLGLYIPPIASKKATGNKQEKFVQERKRFLHYFCIKIASRAYIFYSEEFVLFLRGNVDLQKVSLYSINQSYKELPALNFKEKLDIYKQQFQKLSEKTNSAEILLQNETDYDYMKKAEKKFESIREQFKAVAESKRMYANQFVHVFQNILPEYEQKFLLDHVGKDKQKLILNKEEVKGQIKQYHQLAIHNPLQDYVQMISYELREVRALIEAIQTRKKTEDRKQKVQKRRKQSKQQVQKLQSGKSTFKSMFSSGNKQQQIQKLQKQIVELEADIQNLNELIPLMNISCHEQIKSYKIKKGKEYVNTLKQVATKQIKELSSYGHILKVPLAQFS